MTPEELELGGDDADELVRELARLAATEEARAPSAAFAAVVMQDVATRPRRFWTRVAELRHLAWARTAMAFPIVAVVAALLFMALSAGTQLKHVASSWDAPPAPAASADR